MAGGALGLIAGGGDLPVALAARCTAAGRPVFVVRLRGFADPAALSAFPGADAGLAELGRCLELLRAAGCTSVCFAGDVARPDFAALKPDWRGLRELPGAVAAARRGDDALLRFVLSMFEREGFRVEGAHEVDAALTLPSGALGRLPLPPACEEDAALALRTARAIGALDIGQGAVAAHGVVLAVEAQEGTDAMLRRVAGLPAALRAVGGVLAKAPKPMQERRVDLPTLGAATVRAAAAAGLAGIVGEAGGVLVLDRAGLAAAADELGLFVWGQVAD
ncbi:MAG: UDP-2,3-diacylglucosamine diphosphatase LpxI [Caulobacteraceae bacterium]|nr:UDP-2,3-diacylglucosamine diphosphatase LpxI [Caulobacter sp.]